MSARSVCACNPMRWAAVKLRRERPLLAIPSRAESGGRASQLQALHLLLHTLSVPLFCALLFHCSLLVCSARKGALVKNLTTSAWEGYGSAEVVDTPGLTVPSEDPLDGQRGKP